MGLAPGADAAHCGNLACGGCFIVFVIPKRLFRACIVHVRGRALHLVCTTPCTSLGTGNRVLPLLGYVLLHLHLFLATLLTYVSWMRCCRVHLPVWHVADFLTRESYDADDLESGDSVWPAVELCQPATATKSQAAAQATAVPCAHPPHPPPTPL